MKEESKVNIISFAFFLRVLSKLFIIILVFSGLKKRWSKKKMQINQKYVKAQVDFSCFLSIILQLILFYSIKLQETGKVFI